MPAHRTTFSLDTETMSAVRRLATLWNTSQAGVIRLAVRDAAEKSLATLTPQEAISRFAAGVVPMSSDQLDALVAQARAARLDADIDRL